MNLKHLAIAMALSTVTLIGFACTRAELKTFLNTESEPEAMGASPEPWGTGNMLSQDQVNVMGGLAWPQEYRDMIGTFGYPEKRNHGVDYYLSPEGKWIAVYYNSAGQATGYGYE
ncbi:MAG: hypothetical protein AAF215_27895 [Cyanobacteria bacterium P01_A01_bin.123]